MYPGLTPIHRASSPCGCQIACVGYSPSINMVEHLTEEQVAGIREAFALFDEGGDGNVGVRDLRCILSSLGEAVSDEELGALVDKADGGTIRYEDFLWWMSRRQMERHRERQVREAFRLFDRDDVGFISAAEIKQTMVRLGEDVSEEEVADMIREADQDGDAHISYEEFRRLMTGR